MRSVSRFSLPLYSEEMRILVLLWLAAGCGRLAFDEVRLQPDSAPPSDGPTPIPGFVRGFVVDCGLVTRCLVETPGVTAGKVLVVAVTYNPQTVEVASIEDDVGRGFSQAIAPIAWSPTVGQFRSELWWTRTQATNSLVVTLSGSPTSLLAVYVNEFIATEVDQSAAASGIATAATAFSSGTRTVASAPEIIFGHGEGQGATIHPALGFAAQTDKNANIEETKLVWTPGTYDAQFTIDGAGDWVALMATLR